MAHIMFSGVVAWEAEIDVETLVAMKPHAIYWISLAAITGDVSEDHNYIVYGRKMRVIGYRYEYYHLY